VGGHVLRAFLEGEVVPVLVRVSALVHGIERDVLGVRDRRFEPGLDVPREPGVRLALQHRFQVDVVPRRLGDRDVRRGSFGELGKVRPLEPSFDGVEVGQFRSEVGEQQVGLVPVDAERPRRALRRVGRLPPVLYPGPERALAGPVRDRPPCVPVDPSKVVQRVPAFFGLWRFASFHTTSPTERCKEFPILRFARQRTEYSWRTVQSSTGEKPAPRTGYRNPFPLPS